VTVFSVMESGGGIGWRTGVSVCFISTVTLFVD
jgi:hypothetical protein